MLPRWDSAVRDTVPGLGLVHDWEKVSMDPFCRIAKSENLTIPLELDLDWL